VRGGPATAVLFRARGRPCGGRLGKLDVGKYRDVDGYVRRCVANGLRAEDFVKAVAWSENPAVRAALVALFRRAEDMGALFAALPAVEDAALIRARLEPLLDALPADDRGPYGDGYRLLIALTRAAPDAARPAFERYLRGASADRCHTVCLALREVGPDWDADLLAPLLADRRTWGWTYAVEPGKNEPRLPIRVCDEAALTLSHNRPELTFAQAGSHAELDRQIAAVRQVLARER
jgi:hypothetical protein